MKWLFGGILILLAGAIIGLASFLGPDDLSACDSTPTESVGVCAPADAVVAISGGDTQRRTSEAIQLYQNGWARYIVFAGAAQDTSGPSNAAAMRQQAIDAGIASRAILVEELSRTTAENAQKTQALFARSNIQTIILVTSSYHQRRASLEFHKQLDGRIALRNHPASEDRQWSKWWWLTPSGWWLALSELIKIFAFYIGVTF